MYKNLAQSLLATLADITGSNPYSRLIASNYSNIRKLTQKLMNEMGDQEEEYI